MTISKERMNALWEAKHFMRRLLQPSLTPRVPRSIRREAYYVLKHFPEDYNLEKIEAALPYEFGKEIMYERPKAKRKKQSVVLLRTRKRR